jgi:hypothetical protein
MHHGILFFSTNSFSVVFLLSVGIELPGSVYFMFRHNRRLSAVFNCHRHLLLPDTRPLVFSTSTACLPLSDLKWIASSFRSWR